MVEDPIVLTQRGALPFSYLSLGARSLVGLGIKVSEGRGYTTIGELLSYCRESRREVANLLDELERGGFAWSGELAEQLIRDPRAPRDADKNPRVRELPVPLDLRYYPPDAVVYYVRRANGDIKIGTSKQFDARLIALIREHGDLEVLAIEPGYYDHEADRHDEYRDVRIRPDREWFRPSAELLAHIATLGGGEMPVYNG